MCEFHSKKNSCLSLAFKLIIKWRFINLYGIEAGFGKQFVVILEFYECTVLTCPTVAGSKEWHLNVSFQTTNGEKKLLTNGKPRDRERRLHFRMCRF